MLVIFFVLLPVIKGFTCLSGEHNSSKDVMSVLDFMVMRDDDGSLLSLCFGVFFISRSLNFKLNGLLVINVSDIELPVLDYERISLDTVDLQVS